MKSTKGKSPVGPSSAVDWTEVNRALSFMNQHGLEEFEYARGDSRIRLKKPGPAPLAGGFNPLAGAVAGAPAATLPPAAPQAPAENLHVVKSPIVGTFYSSPNPEAQPYVKVGDRVQAGQVLCIIEAMKLMNEIEADASGEIVKVLATHAQPVEYGEGLFAIRADGK